MVRRRSTVRFRNGTLERGHEKASPTGSGPAGWRLAFPAVYGCSRSPTAVCAQYVPKFSAPRVVIAGLAGLGCVVFARITVRVFSGRRGWGDIRDDARFDVRH